MFSVHVQHSTTRYHDLKVGSHHQKLGHHGCGLNQLLEIIQQQKHGCAQGILQMFFEYFQRRLATALADFQSLHDFRSDLPRIAQPGERHKMNPARKMINQAIRHFHREARFADPARAR